MTIVNITGNLSNRPSFICSGQGLFDLIKDIENPIGLEIGSDVGDTSEYLLSQHETLILHSVDPYVDYTDWNGNIVKSSQVHARYMQRMARFGDRHLQHRYTSDEAVELLHHMIFDFIFIDGIHTYEQVKKDCNNFYSLVKPGGIFAGHDFNAITGVRKAVEEFAYNVGKEILQTDHDVWYWVK